MPGGRIFLDYVHPPIHYRGMDWIATRDGWEPGARIGTGATEVEAVCDLLEQEEDDAAE